MKAINEGRRQQIEASFSRSPMMKFFGAQLLALGEGYVEIVISKQDFMLRPAGMFNGSVIASLVDASSGYAAVSAKAEDSYMTTVELKVNYLNPAIGDQLKAKAEVVKNGKILSVVRSDIYALDGDKETLAATSLVTMMQLKKR